MEQKNILGGLKNVVGNKNSDLVLESLGKIYAKFGDKSYLLNDLFQSLDTISTSNESTIKTVENLSELLTYPGDNIFIFEKSNKNLYFTKNNEYLPLINNSDVTGYLTNPLNEPLEITTRKAPLVVNSTQLVKNLNSELLGGYSHDSYPKKAIDETIKGNWTFEGVNKAKESWTFEKHLAIGGSLISTRGFAPGYSGYGWMLDADTNTLTVDNLIVRKILSVYELVVNKISATNGSLWVSNAGKVETAYKISVTPTSTVSLPFSDTDTTPQVFDDYSNTYFSKDDVITSDTFTINSLLISEELTTEILSSKKLILNSNNVRKFLYLYYNYYGGNFFLIKLDEEGTKYPPFKVGDILRNQKFINNGIRYYDALVTNVNYEEGFFVIRLANSIFDNYNSVILDENGNLVNTTEETTNYYSDSTRNPNTVFVEDLNQSIDTGTEGSPVEGDNLVQIGSISNTNRKNAIYITSTDDRAPYIDVLSGIDRPDYSVILKEIVLENEVEVIKTPNMLKCRLGRLDGIYEPSFKLKQPHGFGLYSDNVFLKGEFYLENGDTLVNFDENKIYLKYKDAGLEISDNSLGEPVLKLFGDQIEFWSGKSGSTDSVKLMSLTTLFNSDGSKINDSLINTDSILALLDVNGIIQSKGLIVNYNQVANTLFNSLVKSSTIYTKRGVEWFTETSTISENSDTPFPTFENRATFLSAITQPATQERDFTNLVVRVNNGNGMASKDCTETYSTPPTSVYNGTDRAIVLIEVQGDSYSYTTLTTNLADFEVTIVRSTQTALPYREGYYIFNTAPQGGLPDGVSLGNIYHYSPAYNMWELEPMKYIVDVNTFTYGTIGCYISPGGKLYAKDAEIEGSIKATSGQIGSFYINNYGLVYGNASKWNDETYFQNLCYITPGTIWLERTYGYFTPGDLGSTIKVGIGENSDPNLNSGEDQNYRMAYSAGYFYRKMTVWNDWEYEYYPAVQIISDNFTPYNTDVALYTKGAFICDGSFVNLANYWPLQDKGSYIDVTKGTQILAYRTGTTNLLLMPTITELRRMVRIPSTETATPIVIPMTITNKHNSTGSVYLDFQEGTSTLKFRDQNGDKVDSPDLSVGDSLSFWLIWDGSDGNYYAQVTNWNH